MALIALIGLIALLGLIALMRPMALIGLGRVGGWDRRIGFKGVEVRGVGRGRGCWDQKGWGGVKELGSRG